MASTILLKAAGLITSPNLLDRPDGAMSEAKNIIIKRDGIIEPARGFKAFGNSLFSTAKQLMQYRNRLLRHYGSTLQYDTDGTGDFASFSGSFAETQSGLRIKSSQSNGNFYFTSSEGIKKIAALNGDGLSSATVTQAGGIKAVDLKALLNYSYTLQTGFLPQDSAVAYRVVWANKDVNGNLIQGTPSQRETVYNPLTPVIIQDMLHVLDGIDAVTDIITTARISDGDYVNTLKLPINATAQELKTNLTSLAFKLDNDILYADSATAPLIISTAVISVGVCTITFSSGDATTFFNTNSKIFLAGFTPATGTLNGGQTINTVSPTTITFTTTATGAVVLSAATIKSNEYTSITQPGIIDIPTPNQELVELQTYLDNIIQRLQSEPVTVITLINATTYIDVLDITTTATVDLTITIPEGITTNDFMQIYRSSIVQAELTTVLADLSPSDELQLVYEAYPTDQELIDGEIVFTDETPDEFRGANLYTNASTGEGITQANDIPPFAKDINRFRNSIFYANTRTRQRSFLNLLGVSKIIADYNNSLNPSITISNGTTSFTYKFILGIQESVDITCTSGATITDSQYFDITSVSGLFYRFWYDVTGSAVAPVAPADTILVRIRILVGDTATQVADKTRDKASLYVNDFEASSLAGVLTILQTEYGYVNDYNAGTVGFVGVTTQGQGEDANNRQVLLSDLTSPARAVDATARSLVRVINKNNDESIYAYYLSGSSDVPGKMLFEGKSLANSVFYIVSNLAGTGNSFNPDISTDTQITGITIGATTTITAVGHNLIQGDTVVLTGTVAAPLNIFNMSPLDGAFTVASVIDANNFVLNITTASATVIGSIIKGTNAVYSENESKVNRVYYSKFQQPEAVPITNYFDVGNSDKEILRIFPLRDSLFVFKEDGLFRISGETSPFNVALFDSSCILKAPDSVSVSNNLVYCWTTQGIVVVSESGVQIISRNIDNQILKLASSSYTNFKEVTWGVGYESDNSYTVFTVNETADAVATIAYRYSNLTDTWTTLTRTNTCGIVFSADDKMYLGAADINFLEQERKNFNRTDYANREVVSVINNGKLSGKTIQLPSVSELTVGDSVVQEQYVTTYEFNNLLQTLDSDPGINDNNYYSLLQAISGSNMRSKMEALATKLDADTSVAQTDYASSIAFKTGSITTTQAGSTTIITSAGHGLFTGRIASFTGTTFDGSYQVTVIDANKFSIPKRSISNIAVGTWETVITSLLDINACYNRVIQKLNTDTGVSFSNYRATDTTSVFEAIITSINKITKTVTLNQALQFYVGSITIYKAIISTYTYSPNTLGEPLSLKHAREATLMFNNRAVTSATLSFSTDLLPAFVDIDFDLDGNGIFGNSTFGQGFFGGSSNSAPFRTYIPRNCQRCRYLVIRFKHVIARESYDIVGTTVTAETGLSTRAYR